MTRIKSAPLFGALFMLAASHAFAATRNVSIDNFTFSPAEIKVGVGSSVVWTNNDDIPHTVTDTDNPRTLKSSPLDTGESYTRKFDKPGTYRYFCSLHPHMQGTVVVR